MKTILLIYGTRPEAIKMAPIIRELNNHSDFKAVVCSTAQHRQLLDHLHAYFGIKPDYDLDIMRENQDLFDITSHCLTKLKGTLEKVQPDLVLVQGDTTTAYVSALAAFYSQIPVGHVEAGLRTHEKFSPFPEEINRRMITPLADFHFAPTALAVQNLKKENVREDSIFEVGNTSIDSLLWTSARLPKKSATNEKKTILLTVHRRESFGAPLRNILNAVRDFSLAHPDFQILCPVHPNPNVKGVVEEVLGQIKNVSLVSPLDYGDLVSVLKSCHFVMTDSGGLQEEAPAFGKPTLVLRNTTERTEAVLAGCARLVGDDYNNILHHMNLLTDENSPLYRSMAQAKNPFGDGTAAKRIVSLLAHQLQSRKAA